MKWKFQYPKQLSALSKQYSDLCAHFQSLPISEKFKLSEGQPLDFIIKAL